MAWTMTRNQFVNEAAQGDRVGQLLAMILDALEGQGNWTLQGSGDGSVSGDMTGTNYISNFPAIAGDNAWFCMQNLSGAEIVIQRTGTSLDCYYSESGGYAAGQGESASARVGSGGGGPPADEMSAYANDNFGGPGTYYASIAVEDDSFIMFSQRSGFAERAIAFTKLTSVKAGDTGGYWLWVRAASGSNNAWAKDQLWNPHAVSPPYGVSNHPSVGQQGYGIPRIQMSSNDDFMDTIPADPTSLNEQLIESLCVSSVAPNEHIRGKIPGILRMSGNRSTGDTFDAGTYIGIGDFAVPWGDAGTPLL